MWPLSKKMLGLLFCISVILMAFHWFHKHQLFIVFQEELKTSLKHLQEKLESFKEMKQSFADTAQHIKVSDVF